MNFQLRIHQALTDIDNITLLIEIWQEANGITQAGNSIPAILSVDAVAFRPTITIDENGKVEGFDGIHQLEAPDIFTQFVLNPHGFRDFVAQHFDQVYLSLFVSQIQPLDPRFTCCVVHATGAINGNENTVTILEIIAERLRETPFSLLRYAFDSDFCFNSPHDGFRNVWEEHLSSGG
jgi:hypothetical protein